MTEKTIARRLREYAGGDDGGGDSFCREIAGEDYWDDFGMRNTARRIAEKVEAEQNALVRELAGPHTSVWRGMNAYAESVGMPMGYEESITSWLDRWFVPRPRYEDGAPVQFGDEYYWADCTMRKITGFGQTENGAPYITCAFDGNGMSDAMIYSGFLRRPTPKALDAGGVEIAEGDVVYLLGDARRLEVADPHAVDDCGDPVVECVVLDDGRGAGDCPDVDVVACKASELTHERPVLDADGVPIREGDTVYVADEYRYRCDHAGYDGEGMFFGLAGYKSGQPITVSSMKDRDGYSQIYSRAANRCNCPSFALTHREPDSLEKLRDDMRAALEESPDACFRNSEYVDRLAALVERGA